MVGPLDDHDVNPKACYPRHESTRRRRRQQRAAASKGFVSLRHADVQESP